jgi:hypothetical protein
VSEPNSKLFRDDPAAYYTELGAQAEQERIIKLLEGTDLLKTIESGVFVNYADTAIELIKGEQK